MTEHDDYLADGARRSAEDRTEDHDERLERDRYAPQEGVPMPEQPTGYRMVDPQEFFETQARKHAHVQIATAGPSSISTLIIVGYDEQWEEVERTRMTRYGLILPNPQLYHVPDPRADVENRDAS